MPEKVYTVFCPFGGVGGGGLGFILARTHLFDTAARFRLIGGVDIDPAACADFEYLTGAPQLCADVATLTSERLRAFAGDEAPDVVFTSAPCVGSSGLLSEAKAKTKKYRELNRLSLIWTKLMLETWPTVPRLLIYENVPRITTRARRMLTALKSRLRKAGYMIHESAHDAGELGGLAQHRRRYLLVARHAASTSSLLYQPVKKRVRPCGEVLGPLPMPNDPSAGPMHVLPKIGWLNWVRLAMIPAGGDWRDLPRVLEEGQKRREKFKRHAVEEWQEPVGTVGGSGSNGVANVADPRVAKSFNGGLGVNEWDQPTGVATGSAAPSRGRFAVADPRVRCEPRADSYGVQSWENPSKAVIGAASVDNSASSVADPRPFKGQRGVKSWNEPASTVASESLPSNGAHSVADPRLRAQAGEHVHHNKYRVESWDDGAHTVIGATRPGSGAPSIADPRPRMWFGNVLRVIGWADPALTVTGGNGPTNGGGVVADPRVKKAYDHGYGIVGWSAPSDTVAGGSHPGQGRYSVADPRVDPLKLVGIITMDDARRTVAVDGVAPELPTPFAVVDPSTDGAPLMVVRDVTKAPPAAPVILADDGTWHRPLTTLELAVLQGLPAVHKGAPLKLAGTSSSDWRKRIGNAVPVQAAEAIAEQMLLTLLSSDLGAFSLSSAGGVWVKEARLRVAEEPRVRVDVRPYDPFEDEDTAEWDQERWDYENERAAAREVQ